MGDVGGDGGAEAEGDEADEVEVERLAPEQPRPLARESEAQVPAQEHGSNSEPTSAAKRLSALREGVLTRISS